MNIVIKNDEEVTSLDKNKIKEFVAFCFGKWDQDKRDQLYFTPTYRHLFIYENETLVAYLRIVLREAAFNDKNILVGGVGDVSTHPDYRGRGLATELVKTGVALLKEAGADIGLLQTDITKGAKQYSAAGFIPMNKSYSFSDNKGAPHTQDKDAIMIAPLKSPQLVQEIMRSEENLYVGEGDW